MRSIIIRLLFFLCAFSTNKALASWTCKMVNNNGHIVLQSYFLNSLQFEWQIGAGGSIAAVRDQQKAGLNLLAPSYAGEITDRTVQWTAWSNTLKSPVPIAGLRDFELRMNITQAGTAANLLAPIVQVSRYTTTNQTCVIEVVSNTQDQWHAKLAPYVSARMPALTRYTFNGGILDVSRFVLVKSLKQQGVPVTKAHIYFEGWSPFSDNAFDTLSLSIDSTGKSNWWYKNNYNVPHYPAISATSTRGWAALSHSNSANSTVVAVVYGKQAGYRSTHNLNLMDFDTGIAILPSIAYSQTPVGSLIFQQIKLFATRTVYPTLGANLDNISATVQRPGIFLRSELNSSTLNIYNRLNSITSNQGIRTDKLYNF